MVEDKTISITIKGISKEAKDNFLLFCAMRRASMQSVLKEFIYSVISFDKGTRNYMMLQTVNNVVQENPALIDKFIIEQEPLFAHLSEIQKVNNRMMFCSLNPTYIYEKYIDWLETEEGIKYE
ncbi:hypothetical protein [Treponema pedis]|uniref:hypothetical protein n=1 Tax=Treponema pedis TaxID=409322 RepID=UPI0004640347|nr:hypothetical protein [Treponema pedis]